MVVFKYPIEFVDEPQPVRMPAGARVLHVDVQAHDLYAWALVDPAQPSVTRMFVLRGTGHKLPDVPLKHVGTALDYGVGLVWHVFEDVR